MRGSVVGMNEMSTIYNQVFDRSDSKEVYQPS